MSFKPPRFIMHVASNSFESARKIETLPSDHRCQRMHGHRFVVTAYASIPKGIVTYPGGEVPTLQHQVDQCSTTLSYDELNKHLDNPTDENLARWIRHRLNVPGVDRVAIQSTPNQGVHVEEHGTVHTWRRYRFQAAHRLPHVPASHKCGRMHGHSFQVVLQTKQNTSNSSVNLAYDEIDALWQHISSKVDYRVLNEISGLENPTSEMISSWIWQQLKPLLPCLSWVSVYETASCGASYDGKNYRIWKDFTIDSAIRYRHAPVNEPRHAIHGCTYTLRLHLQAPLDQIMGWTVDFGDVKAIFDPIFKSLDHQPLHQHAALTDGDTTTIASWIYAETLVKIPELTQVDLFQSEGSGSIVGEHIDGPILPI